VSFDIPRIPPETNDIPLKGNGTGWPSNFGGVVELDEEALLLDDGISEQFWGL
jgi:hypothetical protein